MAIFDVFQSSVAHLALSTPKNNQIQLEIWRKWKIFWNQQINAKIISDLKGRKHLLDRLEENVQEVQNKIGSVRQWNFHQLTLLEYRERNLESWLMDFMEKKEELKDKAREKSEAISKLYGKS